MQRTIEKLTRADLVIVVQNLCASMGPEGDIKLERAMAELEYQKERMRMLRAEEAAKRAAMARSRIVEILAPYDGMRFIDIPTEALTQAAEAEKEADAAEREWKKIMKENRRPA